MDQWKRDEIELGERAAADLDSENGSHPKLREMRVRHRGVYAALRADTKRTLDEVYGA